MFDKLKVGAVVALRGRVQQHPQPTAAAPSGSNGSNGSHQSVLDVVVQEIRVLAKNRWAGGWWALGGSSVAVWHSNTWCTGPMMVGASLATV